MSVTCPTISLAKHVNHRLNKSVTASLHVTACVAEEHVCDKAVSMASNEDTARQDRLRRRRERDRLRRQRETSKERDARLKLTAQLHV